MTRRLRHGILANLELYAYSNAILRPQIEAICRTFGYEPPTICTPQELMEV